MKKFIRVILMMMIVQAAIAAGSSLGAILLMALLGRKRAWLWGFAGNFLACLLLGEEFERRLLVRISRKLDSLKVPPAPPVQAEEPQSAV